LYDEVFGQIKARADQNGRPMEKLRQALNLLARLMRSHGNWIGRVWADAGMGEEVARSFLQRNAPRHMELLMGLAQQAVQAGDLAPLPPMQRFGFLMGSVLMPMLLVPAALQMNVLPTSLIASAAHDVLSDEAIAERIDRALSALSPESTL
jgi:hypothetical protein